MPWPIHAPASPPFLPSTPEPIGSADRPDKIPSPVLTLRPMIAPKVGLGARFENVLDEVETEVSNLRHEIRARLEHATMSDARNCTASWPFLTAKASRTPLWADFRKSAAADENLFHGILKDRSISPQIRISANLEQDSRHEIPFRLAIRRTATWDQPPGCQ